MRSRAKPGPLIQHWQNSRSKGGPCLGSPREGGGPTRGTSGKLVKTLKQLIIETLVLVHVSVLFLRSGSQLQQSPLEQSKAGRVGVHTGGPTWPVAVFQSRSSSARVWMCWGGWGWAVEQRGPTNASFRLCCYSGTQPFQCFTQCRIPVEKYIVFIIQSGFC